jgi:hypothetical protein
MAKKDSKKDSKKKSGGGGSSARGELKAFQEAVKQLKDTARDLEKALKTDEKLKGSTPVRAAITKMDDVVKAILKKFPDGTPPPTIN